MKCKLNPKALGLVISFKTIKNMMLLLLDCRIYVHVFCVDVVSFFNAICGVGDGVVVKDVFHR